MGFCSDTVIGHDKYIHSILADIFISGFVLEYRDRHFVLIALVPNCLFWVARIIGRSTLPSESLALFE